MREEEVIVELTKYCGFTIDAAKRLVSVYPYKTKFETCKSIIRICDSIIAAERIARGMGEDEDFFVEELQ